jgi:hypothetical protein
MAGSFEGRTMENSGGGRTLGREVKDVVSKAVKETEKAQIAMAEQRKIMENKRTGDKSKETEGASTSSSKTATAQSADSQMDAGDDADIKRINQILGETARQTTVLTGDAKTASEKSTSDYVNMLKSLTGADSDLAKMTTRSGQEAAKTTPMEIQAEHQANMDKLLKEKTSLANQQVEQAATLSKWYSGLNKSYEDIAARYNNAITGLGDKERQQMQGQAQQDYAANSALGARAASIPGQGRMQTGAQQQLQMAAGAQGASSAYAAAQDRMAAIDEQRRQMQYSVVGSSMQQEVLNKQAGYGMEQGMIQMQQGVQSDEMAGRLANEANQYTNRSTSYNQTMSNFQAGLGAQATGASNIYGAQQQQMQTSFGLEKERIEAQTSAGIYSNTANMALRNQQRQYGLAKQGLA